MTGLTWINPRTDGARMMAPKETISMRYHYFTLEQRSNLEQAIRAAIGEPGLQDALKRLHGPEYGVCHRCGGDIPYVQLEERPLAMLCRTCRNRA